MRQFRRSISLICSLILISAFFSACQTEKVPLRETKETEVTTETETTSRVGFNMNRAEAAEEKTDTVKIKADASGTPKDVKVKSVLKGCKADFILDKSNLNDIRNTKNDEQFMFVGDDLLWENKGLDITYEGKSSKTPEIGVNIKYYLNGDEVKPKDIVGKSGDVVIHFDYINEETKKIKINDETEERHVPYMFITMVVLDEDIFSDIEVENGKLSSFGGTNLAIGYGIPELKKELAIDKVDEEVDIPEYFEIKAKAKDFKLDFTTTMASGNLFEDVKDEKLDETEEDMDAIDDMKEASADILEGIDALSEGSNEYYSALDGYTDGTHNLYEGINAFSQALDTLDDNSADIKTGMQNLAKGIKELDADLSAALIAMKAMNIGFEDEIGGFSDALSALSEGAEKLEQGINAYTSGVGELAASSGELNDGAFAISNGSIELFNSFGELTKGITELQEGYKEFDEKAIKEISDLANEDMRNLISNIRTAKSIDAQPKSFSNVAEGTKSNVQYIIETEAIAP